MGLQNELPVETAFDVVVRMPSGLRTEDVTRRGLEAGIKPERLQVLVDALRNVPQVQIGKAVPRDRADAAKALYEQAGLVVDITPVLALEAKKVSEEVACPSCRQRVVLTDKRQCPGCGVFVDKFTDDYLDKRRQAELDRASLRRELENEFQAKLDAELVARLKKMGVFKGPAGAGRAVALVALLGAAFVVGRGSFAGWTTEALMASGGSHARTSQMLEAAWPATGKGAAKTEGAVAGEAGAAAGPLDPDLDDPLIQQAGGKRVGAKGLSIEQAVAASRLLARSVGNTTADRAIDGTEGGAPARPEGGPAAAGEAPVVASAAAQAAAPAPAAAVPASAKLSLALDLARQLAAMGQPGRATQMLKTLGPRLQAEPALAGQAQAAAIEARAWAVGAMDAAQARATAEALLAEAGRIGDGATRVRALTQAAGALSQQPQVPREAARAFIARAGEALPSIGDVDAREQATSSWAAGMGLVMLHESTLAARAGRWSVVRGNSTQLQALAHQAPAGAQARLLAMAYQLQDMAGDAAGAAKSLDGALALAAAEPDLGRRAVLLRAIVAGTGSMNDKVAAAVDALQGQLQSRSGFDTAQGLLQLSLLHAEAGFRSKSAEVAEAARRVQGLSPAEALRLHTDLVVRSDLVAARVLHGVGLFGEAEALVQKLGAYLLL